MGGPMEGVKVVEMGFWVAGPSAAAILADWGADVIKIEPPDGDPFRGLGRMFGAQAGVNPPFELDNRGKRGMSLDLSKPEAREIALKLLDEADVFITNVRPGSIDRLGLDYDSVRKTNPRIVYCQVTGYGPDTPDRDRAAYDVGAFWSRAGVARSLVPSASDAPPPQQRGGMGDHMTGLGAAGAISAALYKREKSGEGQRVAISLHAPGSLHAGLGLQHRPARQRPHLRVRSLSRAQPDHQLLPGRGRPLVLAAPPPGRPPLAGPPARPRPAPTSTTTNASRTSWPGP